MDAPKTAFKPSMTPKSHPSPEKWSCRDLRLPTPKAIERFKNYKPDVKDTNIRGVIPDEDLAWILRKIQKCGFDGVVVDVHDHHPDGNNDVGGWHISKLY